MILLIGMPKFSVRVFEFPDFYLAESYFHTYSPALNFGVFSVFHSYAKVKYWCFGGMNCHHKIISTKIAKHHEYCYFNRIYLYLQFIKSLYHVNQLIILIDVLICIVMDLNKYLKQFKLNVSSVAQIKVFCW